MTCTSYTQRSTAATIGPGVQVLPRQHPGIVGAPARSERAKRSLVYGRDICRRRFLAIGYAR